MAGFLIALLLLLVVVLGFALWVATVLTLALLKAARDRLGDDFPDDAEIRSYQEWAMEKLSDRFREKK